MSLTRRIQVLHTNEQRISMETAIKVAFATTDMAHVDQHFGSAKSFAVYAVDPEQSELMEAAQFGELAQDGNEDKLSVKIQLLEGCSAVYCLAIGASAVNQILSHGIQPIKVHEGSTIKDLISDLQSEMKAGPSSWLAKAISQHKGPNPERFNAMEEEGWDE
ncbi:nitrogen fixation protein NifX [Methylomonas methanica]|uniref:Nitrogen fixation protein NifX n=2 Tax=Methylomonas methanica TaxID=421 RepID=A0A177MLB4_METMH|nr:nitrogen fixation protein NifX [Methylomonas methanica]